MQFPINQTTGDPVWNLPTAFSLVYEGNIDLSEYQKLIDRVKLGYTLNYINNRPYNNYPVGASFVAVPFVLVANGVANLISVDLRALSQENLLTHLDMFIACATVAGAAAFLYLIARFYLSNFLSLLIVLIFAFGSSALSTASRGLWQHGPTMLMLSMSLYALLSARRSPAFLIVAGFALAFAYIIRPTNSISVIVLSFYVLLTYRTRIVLFLAGALIISLPFFYLNQTVYGQLLPPYFTSYFLFSETLGGVFVGLLGNLISPNRGLFIFSPVLLFSVVGVSLKLRARSVTRLEVCLLAIIVIHWLVVSSYRNWYAGYSFGSRYMTDMLPYFAFFLIPFLMRLPSLRRLIFFPITALLVIATGVSLAIHVRGASEVATQFWNSTPLSVDNFPSRVWDWSDLQFLRVPKIEPRGSADLGAVSGHRFEFDEATTTFEEAGWGTVERTPDGTTFQWTIEKEAALDIRLNNETLLQVKIGLQRAMTPEILATFRFTINGQPIALHEVDGSYVGIITPNVITPEGQPSELRFSVDNVVSPQSLGEGDDTRTLGLLLDYLDIAPAERAPSR